MRLLPITLLFTFLDYKNDGSFGKAKAGLELVYQKKTVQASLIRNTIKFLPWQIGHNRQNRGEKYKTLRLNFCKLWDAIKKNDVNKHRT